MSSSGASPSFPGVAPPVAAGAAGGGAASGRVPAHGAAADAAPKGPVLPSPQPVRNQGGGCGVPGPAAAQGDLRERVAALQAMLEGIAVHLSVAPAVAPTLAAPAPTALAAPIPDLRLRGGVPPAARQPLPAHPRNDDEDGNNDDRPGRRIRGGWPIYFAHSQRSATRDSTLTSFKETMESCVGQKVSVADNCKWSSVKGGYRKSDISIAVLQFIIEGVNGYAKALSAATERGVDFADICRLFDEALNYIREVTRAQLALAKSRNSFRSPES